MIVSEIFTGLQGEGNTLGTPSVFVRLGGCNLDCKWCDTKKVWTKGVSYSVDEVVEKITSFGIPLSWFASHRVHIVLTGGEPLMPHHEEELLQLFSKLRKMIGAKPYIEVETNGTYWLSENMAKWVKQVNCSPKLKNSGVPVEERFNEFALRKLDELRIPVCFKFVIADPGDLVELNKTYGFIAPERIILMPAAKTRRELIKNSRMVWEAAMQNGYRATTRLQTIAYNNQHGK